MNRIHRWYCQSDRWKRHLASEILPWALQGIALGDDVLELGPGPGLTTEWLSRRTKHITGLELDRSLALALSRHIPGGQVKVEIGDATAMPFRDRTFSAVLSFTMLHHVPAAGLQDRVFREACRVLHPGGIFAGTDSIASLRMRIIHIGDTLVPIDPQGLPRRLAAAGFTDVAVESNGERFRFRASRPA